MYKCPCTEYCITGTDLHLIPYVPSICHGWQSRNGLGYTVTSPCPIVALALCQIVNMYAVLYCCVAQLLSGLGHRERERGEGGRGQRERQRQTERERGCNGVVEGEEGGGGT